MTEGRECKIKDPRSLLARYLDEFASLTQTRSELRGIISFLCRRSDKV